MSQRLKKEFKEIIQSMAGGLRLIKSRYPKFKKVKGKLQPTDNYQLFVGFSKVKEVKVQTVEGLLALGLIKAIDNPTKSYIEYILCQK